MVKNYAGFKFLCGKTEQVDWNCLLYSLSSDPIHSGTT